MRKCPQIVGDAGSERVDERVDLVPYFAVGVRIIHGEIDKGASIIEYTGYETPTVT